MTPHEFVRDEGWWVCIWCRRTGKDKSLLESADCNRPDGLRIEDNEKKYSPLESDLVQMTQAVSDEALRDMGFPKVLQADLTHRFKKLLKEKNRVLLEHPVYTAPQPMTTMPGYNVAKIVALTAQGVEVKVTKTISALPTSILGTYNALSGGSALLEDAMAVEVSEEVRRRKQHVMVGAIRYSHLPYGSDQMVVSATFTMIPKSVAENAQYVSLPEDWA